MNKFSSLLLLLLLFSLSCTQDTNKAEVVEKKVYDYDPTKNNEELKDLHDADQKDRKTMNIDWSVVSKRDDQREKRVYELLDADMVRTSEDYANAAMIFQHGDDTVASGMAVKLMRKAIEMDSTRDKWLLAAAVDRDLMRRGVPQIYGTQFRKASADEPWERYQLDSTKITDEERKIHGVETLAEQREKIKMMNKIKMAELLNEGKSIDDIVKLAKNADLQNSEYNLLEGEINIFGYQLLQEEKNEEALKIFKLNTELYPEGFNTFDSYGECLIKLGKKEEGVAAYQKSLELNPNNDNAKKVLAELL